MQTSTRPTAFPSPPPPPATLAANEKLASGPQSSLTDLNIWQTKTFTPQMRWGNDYMHARYYSSNFKRFLSPDPIGGDPASPQSWNRYAYVLNNPLRYVDPFGLSECQKTGPGEWTCTDHAVGEDGASSNEYDPYEEWMFWIRMGQDRFGPLEITVDGPVSLQNQASIYRQMLFDEVFSGEAELLALDLGFTMEEIGAIFGSESTGSPADFLLFGLAGGLVGSGSSGAARHVLTGYSKHAINQAISRDGGGVSARAILNTLRSPIKQVAQPGGKVMIVGQHAVVILNSEGRMVTTWATTSAGLRWMP